MTLLKTFALSSALSLVAPLALAQPDFEFFGASAPEDGSVVVFVDDSLELSGVAGAIDRAANGRVRSAMGVAEYAGGFGETLSLIDMGPHAHVVLIGTGGEALNRRELVDLGGYAAMAADDEDGLSIITESLSSNVVGASAYVAKGYAFGDYTFNRYKSGEEDEGDGIVRLVGATSDAASLFESDLSHVVDGVSLARDLGNAPGNEIYPETFVERVRTAFRGTENVTFRILDEDDMERRDMGALLGVGLGSVNESRLLVINYQGAGRDDAPIALVGKGVTFDTGGISIKPSENMWRMKADLSGAAAVAGTMLAAASRGEEINLVGVMPLAENMPAADAIRPGDVLTTMSGKTIEILNTDAEGRLILADAVSYAQEEYEPRMLVNIATLTGSAARAAGDEYAVVITRDFDLSLSMMEVGNQAGEDVWPLPLHPNHFDQIKSDIADIKNIGGSPGASIGAAVVGTFVDEDLPWVHLDMAGVFFADGTQPAYPSGHAGWGVRFMDELVRSEAE